MNSRNAVLLATILGALLRPPGVYAQQPATGPTTAPATSRAVMTPTDLSRTAAEDLNPSQTVVKLFQYLEIQDLSRARQLIVGGPTVAELQTKLAGQMAILAGGRTDYRAIDEKIQSNLAMVVLQVSFLDENNRKTFDPLMLLRRHEHWEIFLEQPNLRQFTPDERKAIDQLNTWAMDKLKDLNLPATTQSTQPATTQSNQPATAP